jgi:hypothetical protein
LKIVYRTASAAYDVAGLEGVDIQHDQLVNVDLSHLISGWCDILSFLGVFGLGRDPLERQTRHDVVGI